MGDRISDQSLIGLNLIDTHQLTGAAFLEALCGAAKDAFDANTVFIASLGIVEAEHLFVEAVSSRDPSFDYAEFCGTPTPCANVVETGNAVCIAEDVCAQYPDAKVLRNLGSEAYVGLPLTENGGHVVGVLVLEWSYVLTRGSVEAVRNLLQPHLHRISDEMRRKVADHVIPSLMSPIDPVPGHDRAEVFRTIVRQAVELSNIHAVVISYRLDDDNSKFRVLAANHAGMNLDELEGVTGDYETHPCGKLVDNDIYFEDRGIRGHYPDAPILQILDAEAYLGIGFRNSSGQTIGHVVFLHNRPMRQSIKDCKLIGIIASRTGQELQRFVLERKHDAMQAALRVRSKLESLGTMAGTIAHDFNNQLTAMIGNTEMAMLELPAGHPAHIFMKNAEDSMWRARDVISEIMDFAGNHHSSAPERTGLGDIIESAINEFAPRLNGQSSIVSEVEPGLPDILGRRVQIFQIISNLIANGLDALDDSEFHQITIKAETVSNTALEREVCLTGQCEKLPDRCVRLEIQDFGSGMDGATAERIFDPYFSSKGVSRGLGLSSVLGIARRMQIGLSFESELGVGTTFRLYFAPFEDENTLSSETKQKDPYRAPNLALNKTALVVDDELGVQKIVSQMLTLWGYKVVTASSGEQAIVLAKTLDRLDMAVVDVVMPGINGFETLTELRKLHSNLPAVVVSGFSERSLAKAFASEEKVKFLVKPFGARALLGALDGLLKPSNEPA